jgi:hypothetical protein
MTERSIPTTPPDFLVRASAAGAALGLAGCMPPSVLAPDTGAKASIRRQDTEHG